MDDAASLSPPPSFAELVRVSARIGALSFGGPAGQIALMHSELVERRRWIDEDQFLYALNFCHLLPGPEAQQLATYIGWKLHGWRGGLAAGMLFVIPGVIVMLGLSILYAYAAGLGWVAAMFQGVKAAVLAVVVQAVLRVAGRALTSRFRRGIAILSFVALAAFNLPFPLVVLAAALAGWAAATWKPALLAMKPVPPTAAGPRPSVLRTAATILICLILWAAPMLLIALLLGRDHVLWPVGIFFSKLAIVTFGGAYAVLAYMAQAVVQSFHWLRPGEMADGLGLAETTPGPLILVTQFVGFLAAFRAPGPLSPLGAGVIGALLTSWVTYVPCFLWIFSFAPWIDRLRGAVRLQGALAAVTAAVVGVIANLFLWFALHVLFTRMIDRPIGPVVAKLPDPLSFDWPIALVAIAAGVALIRFRIGLFTVLALSALAGLAIHALGG
jgi:chromate transporter